MAALLQDSLVWDGDVNDSELWGGTLHPFDIGSVSLGLVGHMAFAPTVTIADSSHDFTIDLPVQIGLFGVLGFNAVIEFEHESFDVGPVSLGLVGHMGLDADVASAASYDVTGAQLDLFGHMGITASIAINTPQRLYDDATRTVPVFDEYDTVNIIESFAHPDTGVPINPDTVTFTTRKPDGVRTVYVYGVDSEIVRDEDGIFRMSITQPMVGRWRVNIEGTGVAQQSTEAQFRVQRSRVY